MAPLAAALHLAVKLAEVKPETRCSTDLTFSATVNLINEGEAFIDSEYDTEHGPCEIEKASRYIRRSGLLLSPYGTGKIDEIERIWMSITQ